MTVSIGQGADNITAKILYRSFNTNNMMMLQRARMGRGIAMGGAGGGENITIRMDRRLPAPTLPPLPTTRQPLSPQEPQVTTERMRDVVSSSSLSWTGQTTNPSGISTTTTTSSPIQPLNIFTTTTPASSPIQLMNFFTIIVLTLLIIVIASVVVMVVVVIVRRRVKRRNESLGIEDYVTGIATDDQAGHEVDDGHLTPDIERSSVARDEPNLYLNMDEEFGFPRDQLKMIKELGSGQFGRVMLAETTGIKGPGSPTKLAVKTIKEGAEQFEKQSLLRELNLMKKFKPHPNVLGLVGCCIEKDPIYVIVDYMDNGNLKDFLIKSRREYSYANTRYPDIQSSLSQGQLLAFAKHVADGMDYIASNQCIHRDLAARNILVGGDLVCRVSDFGLARDIMNVRVYGRQSDTPLPIRWMALESLVDDIFTKESDVWSFGILLWEIITFGARPYPGMGTKAVIRDLRQGYRMPQPKHCTKEIYDIMLACWASAPSRRPTFKQLSNQLDDVITTESNYLLLDEIEDSIYDDTAVADEDEKL